MLSGNPSPSKLSPLAMVQVLTLLLVTSLSLAQADTLRRGMGAEPDSLDIHQAQGLAAMQILRDVNEGLVTFDEAGELAPGLAESWQVSEDGRQWRFMIRERAMWSNGDPIRADDFVRGWQMAVAPGSMARTAALLGAVSGTAEIMSGHAEPATLGVRAETPTTLLVQLAEPSPWFLEILAHPVTYPVHASAGSDESGAPVSGAFIVDEHVPNSHVRLRPNPNYHAAATVQLETVDYLPVDNPGTELSRYRSGEIEITETIPPGRHDWLVENLPDQLHISPYLGSFWLGINLQREPLGGDADLRRALALAIDRETLTSKVLGAGEVPAWSVVPPGMSAYRVQNASGSSWPREQREALALELYSRSGYGEGNPLRVQIRFNTSTQHRRMAVAVSAMWKQVLGVNTELVHEEWKVFVNNRRLGQLTEVFRGGWIADYADPASFLDLFRSGDPLNNVFYANPAYDGLLARAAVRVGAQRMELLQQAETLLMRDMPVIPLYYYVSRHLVKPSVTGFTDNVRDIHLSRYLGITPEVE